MTVSPDYWQVWRRVGMQSSTVMALVVKVPPRLERTEIDVGGTRLGWPGPPAVGSTMKPGASSCQHGSAVGHTRGAASELVVSTMPETIGCAALPGTPAGSPALTRVACMNMPAGAGLAVE